MIDFSLLKVCPSLFWYLTETNSHHCDAAEPPDHAVSARVKRAAGGRKRKLSEKRKRRKRKLKRRRKKNQRQKPKQRRKAGKNLKDKKKRKRKMKRKSKNLNKRRKGQGRIKRKDRKCARQTGPDDRFENNSRYLARLYFQHLSN